MVSQVRRCFPEEPEVESSPDAEPPPRTRVAEDEEQMAAGDAVDVSAVEPDVASAVPAVVTMTMGAAHRVRHAARGPEHFEALRFVYGTGPPRRSS